MENPVSYKVYKARPKKCRFYDDGCGNGSYISGASCGPPSCTIGGDDICSGKVSKCNVKRRREARLQDIIDQVKKEI